MNKYAFIALLLAFMPNIVCSAAEPMKKLNFAPQREGIWKANAGTKEIILTDTLKSKGAPDVWDGGIQIHDLKAGRFCKAEIDMVAEVYARAGGKVVIFVTEVGAGEDFNFIEIDTCKSIYPELHGYSQRPHIKNNKIVLGPVCEQLEAGKAFCSAAEIYVLDADDRPVLQENESMARTVQVLGVGFKGGRLVENAKTKSAKLLPEEKDDGWFSSIRKWFSH